MATANITKARVDRMSIGDVLWDDDVRGYGVRRRRRETSYVLKYRAGGKQRFITIGKHGAPWTPDTARKEARRLLGAIHAGNDPAVRRDRLNREMTVSAVLDRYLEDHVEAHNKPTTRSEAKRHVETLLKPEFGKLKISVQIRHQDVALHLQRQALCGQQGARYSSEGACASSDRMGAAPRQPRHWRQNVSRI